MQRIRALVGACLLVAYGTVCAQGKPQANASVSSAASTGAPCPTPSKNWPPSYTKDMARENATGSVVLGATTDACGHVLSVTVQKSSGHKVLDNAAMIQVREWTLNAAQRAQAVNGVVPLLVDFRLQTLDASAGPKPPDWPKTHRHPRYVLADGPSGYANAADAETAIDALKPSWRLVPYPISGGNFVQLDAPTGREFWYFIYKGNKPDVAVRYQPVFDTGEPIVRLTVICDKQPKQCVAIRALMMKGLDYARAKD